LTGILIAADELWALELLNIAEPPAGILVGYANSQ